MELPNITPREWASESFVSDFVGDCLEEPDSAPPGQ
jgi:hypothetical protein